RPDLRAAFGAALRGGPAARGAGRDAGRLAPPGRAPPGRATPVSDVYVYALLGEAPHPDAGAGLCAEPLRVVRVGDLVAAVGEMAERPPVSEATLRAHDAVIRRLAGAVDAILPVRFGSLLSESGLADLLTARGRELREALALVAGREQMTLRLLGAATPPEAPASPPDDLGPGARSLPARRAERRRAREASAHVRELESLRAELERRVGDLSPPRWNAEPEDVQRSVARLVLTLVEFVRQLMERQAIRRMEAGSLTPEETEDVGRALMRL